MKQMKRYAPLAAIGSASAILALLLHQSDNHPTDGAPGKKDPQSALPEALSSAGTAREPHAATQQAAAAKSGALAANFLDAAVKDHAVSFVLPNGLPVVGEAAYLKRDGFGVLVVQGKLTAPTEGNFFFQRQTVEGKAGSLVGSVQFDNNDLAWRVEPSGPGGAPELVERPHSSVLCSPKSNDPLVLSAFDTHPTNIAQPSYQPVQPLTSRPGAAGVIYIDFDGQQGPFPGWGLGNPNFDAAPSGMTNAQIFEVWQRVSEDYAPFDLCVTTDLRVYANAPQGQRIRSIITPTRTAYPSGGGNALLGSFNWSGDPTCWTYYLTPKECADACAHEVGHTLGLLHHGTSASPYYTGGGSGVTSWAPIMGGINTRNLSQWCRGEYTGANNPTQDDILIIATQNNAVTYRPDDFGDTLGGAGYLNILADNTVSSEGVIESRTDVDAFRFQTSGGAVSLLVKPAVNGPNLDILAELCNASTGAVLVSVNDINLIEATVSTTLAAGEYLLKVSGVGRSVPTASDGYSDYASLGTFVISGSVTGGTKPDRLTVAENSANGTAVGTVAPRVNHGGNGLTYSIASGNGTGAFSINAAGQVTVANSALLDFEQLSQQWDDLPTFELTVSIVDTVSSALNESIRVIVTLTNVNEAPTASNASVTLLEHTQQGLSLVRVLANDVDAQDFPSYVITAGNEADLFSIDALGNVSLDAPLDLSADTDYTLTVQVSDQGTPALTTTVTVNIHAVAITDGYTPGTITRTIYDNVPGATVASLTSSARYPGDPDREWTLTEFKGGLVAADSFGSTVRGYVIPPTTGSYEFWISGNDATELWLSTDANPANAVRIAYNTTLTNEFDWTASPTQHAAARVLTAGVPYYIEARHKQDINDDHLAVAWAGPGISQQVIPGRFLAPNLYQNYPPHLAASSNFVRENAIVGSLVATLSSTDVNPGGIGANYLILSGNTGNVFALDPPTGKLTVRAAGLLNATTTPTYTLSVSVADPLNATLSTTGTVTVTVRAAALIAKGTFSIQRWLNISGGTVADLTSNPRYPYSPDVLKESYFAFNTANASLNQDNYGERARFLAKPDVSGAYTFNITGDNAAQLFVSTDATAANASLAAYTDAPSGGITNYTAFPSQTSGVYNLVAGQKYYIEVRQKETTGSDYWMVSWKAPGETSFNNIGNPNTEPYDYNVAPTFSAGSYTFPIAEGSVNNVIVGLVGATDPDGDAVARAIVSGNTNGAFAIDAATGVIRVANAAALTPYAVFNLTVTAQDYGIGGVYPLKSANVAVTIYVDGPNVPPTWLFSQVVKPDAIAPQAYSGQTLVGSVVDLNYGEVITFSKVSGPSWLTVAGNGSLSGTPAAGDAGDNLWIVRATDSGGLFADSTLKIVVQSGNTNPPVAPWSTGDIGSTGLGGSTYIAGSGFSQNGGGVGVNAKVDAGQFLKQTLTGDGEIRAQILSFTGGAIASTGVMFRETTNVGSREVSLEIENGNVVLNTRTGSNTNASTITIGAANAAPNNWLRLTKSGTTINAYRSSNGTTWTLVNTQSISFPTSVLVGLWTASGNTTSSATAVTNNVSVTPFPAPWVNNQIGSVSAITSGESYNSIYTINGAGTIGGSSSDAGTYLHQTLTGDGQIIARLSTVQNTSTAARFGVMIRDTTSSSSKQAFMGVSPDGTFRFMTRSSNNGSTTSVSGGTGTFPNCWVKLVRAGNVFTGFKSSNGTTWTQVGTATITMGSNIRIGIINGSGSTSVLNRDLTDNVSVVP
jgi:regulation of enolase protein 1 (concanavalin A-like superfamily)